MTPHQRRRRQAARAVVWSFAGFIGLQVVFAAAVEWWLPQLRDPEYGHRVARLERHRAVEPARPWVIALGSSRTAMGFCPSALPELTTAAGASPRVFNFAGSGYGTLHELLTFERLLARGVRPCGLIVEVLPNSLNRRETPDRLLRPSTSPLGTAMATAIAIDHPHNQRCSTTRCGTPAEPCQLTGSLNHRRS